MNKEKSSLLAEFAKKSLQRLEAKKRPRYQMLHVPSLDMDIKIRSLTTAEFMECQEAAKKSGDKNMADKSCLYAAVIEPSLKDTVKEIMAQEAGLSADQKQILEPLDIVNIFEPHEMDEIVVEIMRLSGFMSDDKVTVVTDALKN
jgi:hypothetical protein